MTTLDYLRTSGIFDRPNIRIYLREYGYPTPPPGSKPTPGKLFSLKKEQFMDKSILEKRIENMPKNKSLGIESKVKVGDRVLYLPIMDFSVGKSKESVNKIKAAVGKFGGGAIIETDNSYNYIGNKLLSRNQLLEFIYWNLIDSTLCDTQYIGYWLLKGDACLRVSPRPNKPWPKVISQL